MNQSYTVWYLHLQQGFRVEYRSTCIKGASPWDFQVAVSVSDDSTFVSVQSCNHAITLRPAGILAHIEKPMTYATRADVRHQRELHHQVFYCPYL